MNSTEQGSGLRSTKGVVDGVGEEFYRIKVGGKCYQFPIKGVVGAFRPGDNVQVGVVKRGDELKIESVNGYASGA